MMRNVLINVRHKPMNLIKACAILLVSWNKTRTAIPTSNIQMLTKIYFFTSIPSSDGQMYLFVILQKYPQNQIHT